jgi:predicted house-cleaning noncanonical NTP pyrophosphatase (MazG superfamily)
MVMSITYYNKLVRDKIVDRIHLQEEGNCDYRCLDDEEYTKYLEKKLQEEVNEYSESNNIEELADLIEVIYAIVHNRGLLIEELENIRLAKKLYRGGFDKKLFLVSVTKEE